MKRQRGSSWDSEARRKVRREEPGREWGGEEEEKEGRCAAEGGIRDSAIEQSRRYKKRECPTAAVDAEQMNKQSANPLTDLPFLNPPYPAAQTPRAHAEIAEEDAGGAAQTRAGLVVVSASWGHRSELDPLTNSLDFDERHEHAPCNNPRRFSRTWASAANPRDRTGSVNFSSCRLVANHGASCGQKRGIECLNSGEWLRVHDSGRFMDRNRPKQRETAVRDTSVGFQDTSYEPTGV
ncbi:hypothetical protein C8R47DRAFT_1197989 [Mycena vitilis]|nr:hypothetical protein C8R47DRAFT_1197989 [Mycena vitilis]